MDTGLFVTASHDMTVKVWDSNEMVVESHFDLPAAVRPPSSRAYPSHTQLSVLYEGIR